jgi:hypothetical protein
MREFWSSRVGACGDDIKPAKAALDSRPAPFRGMPGQTVQNSSRADRLLSTDARLTDRSAILRAATGPWMCAPPAAAGRPERELLFLLARACRQVLLR